MKTKLLKNRINLCDEGHMGKGFNPIRLSEAWKQQFLGVIYLLKMSYDF